MLQTAYETAFLKVSFMISKQCFFLLVFIYSLQEIPRILITITYLQINQIYQNSKCRQMVAGTVD